MSTATKAKRRSPRSTVPRPRVSRMSPSLLSAHELAKRGLSVFPLKPRTKDCPLTKHGFKEATTDPEQIERWWTKYPNANIGIATGNGLTVLDIDSEDALAYAQEMGLPDTLVARSGRDGFGQHHYFSGDLRNKLKLHPKIDVQGLGAYVVAPPSVHPITGALYEWMTDPAHPLALVPEWALETPEKPSQAILGECGRADGKFVEGERNTRLYERACAMRGIGMSGSEIAIALLAVNEDRCDPPLDDDHVLATARSAANHPVNWKPDNDLLAVARMTTKPTSLPVYIAVRKSCGVGDHCLLSYEKLEELTGKSRDAVVSAIDDLIKRGFVERKKRRSRGIDMANEYRLLEIPPDA
jgi:hypothetical protein